MNRILTAACLALALLVSASVSAKPKGNTVEVVVSASGATTEEARHACFRSALEQVCGAFVSSGTLMTDDDISYDEIVSYSSGSIASYKELSVIPEESGVFVTMSVTIGVTEFSNMLQNSRPAGITSYTFDPSDIRDMYNLNVQLGQMQKDNEKKVLQQMLDEIAVIAPTCYEYKSFEARQVVNSANTRLKYIISADVGPNDALYKIDQLVFSTFDALTKINLKTLKSEDEGAWVEVRLNLPKYLGLTTKTTCNVYLISGDYISYIKAINRRLRDILDDTFVIEDKLAAISGLDHHWTLHEDLHYLITGSSYYYEHIEDIATSVKHQFTPSEYR